MTSSKPEALSPLSLHPQWLSVPKHKSDSTNVRIGERIEKTPLSMSLTMGERLGDFSTCPLQGISSAKITVSDDKALAHQNSE